MGLVENDTNFVDIQIPGVSKQRFRINGDNDKILELNTSDVNIISRLNKGYNELMNLVNKVSEISTAADDKEPTEKQLEKMAVKLDEIDGKMRGWVDYIFDSNVSEVCAGNASMYDPTDGKFRFEHIIESLGKLYAGTVNEEFEKMRKRVSKHTNKYTKKA